MGGTVTDKPWENAENGGTVLPVVYPTADSEPYSHLIATLAYLT